MAIALKDIDFIVPLETIRSKYSGGWYSCLSDQIKKRRGNFWFDNHLLRVGARNPVQIQSLVREWFELGFTPYEERNGIGVRWIDFCVFEVNFGGPTLACDWLVFEPETNSAYLKGTEAGEIIGPSKLRKTISTIHSYIGLD